MSGYCHLSLDERFAIARLHEIGISRRSIARELGRSPSTIKRELMRNSNADGRYRPETAEARYLARRTKGLLLDRLDGLASFVVERLHENWTPEQIAGWLKSEAERLRAISHETTFDNDTAFARHGLLRQALELTTFFCDAYASWQKGAVENINGRLRRDLPRKINIDKLSDQDLQDILLMHNLTPRKCLGFKTPAQALLQQLGLDIKISFHRGVALQN